MELADLIASLERLGVVPVVQLPDPALAVPLADALAAGGLPVVELTFRTGGTAAAIAAVRARRPAMLVGAGTVLNVEQADAAIDAGAHFLVSPGTNPDVVEHVLDRHGIILPGVATPSEIEANAARGLHVLKLFPAGLLGGRAFLAAMLGPYRQMRFVPTGGVSAGNLREYLTLPNVLACAGSWLAPGRRIQEGAFDEITAAAREAASIVRELRGTVEDRATAWPVATGGLR